MSRPLDGVALHAYFHRLGFEGVTQDLLSHIRNSPPSRTPGARHGNMPVWYPSKKMQCIIKAESAKVEFAFLLQAEHDDDVLEIWDQPPSIPLEYQDKRGRLQRPMHTADYFVFGQEECAWIECKPTDELLKQERTRPNRFIRDEQGNWRCPPGETFAAKYGLTYRVWSSDQINWAAQDNALYLEDYYQDLERLQIPKEILEILYRFVDEYPDIILADLRDVALDEGISADLINIAIAKHDLYIDLATYRLSEPWRTPVFHARPLPRASSQSRDQSNEMVAESKDRVPRITSEGQVLLDQASDVDLATALFRNRVIHPEQYDDEEQERTAQERAAVPERTRQYWQQQYRKAEIKYGRGFIGLLPRYRNCGGNRQIAPEAITLIHQVLETHYDTVRRAPKRGAYGEYLKCSEERALKPVSQWTFYLESKRHKPLYEQMLLREGTRAAYPFKDYTREREKTILRHGSYAWELAHIDHTELDLALCDIKEEPALIEHWEFLYARSIGCIGWLKLHLNRALNLALTEQAKTVTLAHLRKTAPAETRVELALRNALESEAELAESDGADERLLTLLGLRGSRKAQASKAKTDEPSPSPKQPDRPGKRSPSRDATGQEEKLPHSLSNKEQAAG